MIARPDATAIGRVVATELKPSTPHQFHLWTATESSIGIGAIVKVVDDRTVYAVVTEGVSAKSEMSNIAAIVPIDVPAPPDSVAATAKREGVVLTWKAPQKSVTGNEKVRVVGYNIYRSAPNETLDELATPVNATPVSQTTYTDVPAYGPYQYVVTALAATGPPRVESDPSSPQTAAH